MRKPTLAEHLTTHCSLSVILGTQSPQLWPSDASFPDRHLSGSLQLAYAQQTGQSDIITSINLAKPFEPLMNLRLGGQGSVLELSHFCNHETVEQTATRTQIKETCNSSSAPCIKMIIKWRALSAG